MNLNSMRWMTVLVALFQIARGAEPDANHTSRFPIGDCHFSVFGGGPHLYLNPGHQLILRGREDGEWKEIIITPLNATREISLPSAEGTRRILARVVEERESVDSELNEVTRHWYARCVESGDIYYFGQEADFYDAGVLAGSTLFWEAGKDSARPGMIMPRTFMVGARYTQNYAPSRAIDLAENIDMGLAVTTPAGAFTNCVRVRESDALRPENPSSTKTYAAGAGLVSDDDRLWLEEFRLGVVGLPAGGTFVPFSHHPFLPISPGRRFLFEGMRNGAPVSRTTTVLPDTREIVLDSAGMRLRIPARIVESQDVSAGKLIRVARAYLAECLETGDVFCFGEQISDGGGEAGFDPARSWMAGVNGAEPGIVLPAILSPGAAYSHKRAEGAPAFSAVNAGFGQTVTVAAGTFTNCFAIAVSESGPAGVHHLRNVYARGIGLIQDHDGFELSSYSVPGISDGRPVLSQQSALRLSWPLTDGSWRIETSADLEVWTPLPHVPGAGDGRNQAITPYDSAHRFFRLEAR
jgi:hypothetical protein